MAKKIKAYRWIPIYATDEQKADPDCWSISVRKPNLYKPEQWIIEELY